MRRLLIAALLLPAPLLAQEEERNDRLERAQAALAEKDVDRDGRLSPEELGVGPRLFALLDRNGDGFVTADELAPGGGRRPQRGEQPVRRKPPGADAVLERHDADGDGRLSEQEFPEAARKDFARADRNGDGFVDRAELEQAFRSERKGPPPGGPGQGPPDLQQVRKAAAGVMKKLDTDGDGRLSAGELPPTGRLDLTAADKDGDGFVDLFELGVAMVQRQQGARRGPGGKGRRLGEAIRRMDANGDGAIDREEWKGPPEAFQRLDKDGDGVVSKNELKEATKGMEGWRGRAGEAMFRRMDADGDGRISIEEWKLNREFFGRFDGNGDGFVTPDEVMLWRKPQRREINEAATGKDSAQFLLRHDRNGDGRVTPDEFRHERRFAEMDADGDGILSKEEIEEALDKQLRESRYGFFERFDLDGDGKVTREEFTGPAAAFEAKDRNHDGVIDAADRPDGK